MISAMLSGMSQLAGRAWPSRLALLAAAAALASPSVADVADVGAEAGGGLSAVKASEKVRAWPGGKEISGITWAGGDTYYAVDDADGRLYRLSIVLGPSGSIVSNRIESSVAVSGANDMEGCAFDPLTGNVWVSDEFDATIREIDPKTGAALRSVDVPAVQKQFYYNFSLESLDISKDGLSMWTCNEETLRCDGTNSTKTAGSVVRLTRFVRRSAGDDWTASGQWAYVTEPVGTNPFVWKGYARTRSGVSDVAVMPDGTLLVLERTYRHEGVLADDFYARVYSVDFSGATDVSGIASLKGAEYVCAKKSLLYSTGRMTMVNYEGMCLGPSIGGADGEAASLVLVSDSGQRTSPRLMTLRLSASRAE